MMLKPPGLPLVAGGGVVVLVVVGGRGALIFQFRQFIA